MSESALLRAVRDRIRLHADFENRQVEVELDEHVPPTSGDLYVLVVSAGVEPGPSHVTNAGAIDKLYNVDVTIAMRAPRVPSDRRRSLFIGLSQSFETYEAAVELQVDFKYPVLAAANAYLFAETGSTEGFIEPLKFAGVGPFRQVPAETFYAASGEIVAAVVRTIRFRGARRIQTRV